MQQFDDQLRKLFKETAPSSASDAEFMSRLLKNMEAVEGVKQHVASLHKRNRIALVAAVMAGFITGVLCTWLLPVLGNLPSMFNITLQPTRIYSITIDWRILGWLVSGALCVLAAMQTYGITLARLAKIHAKIR